MDEIQQEWHKYLDLAREANKRADFVLYNHYSSIATGLLIAINILKGK